MIDGATARVAGLGVVCAEGAGVTGIVGAVVGLLSRENICSNLECIDKDVRG